MQMEWPAEMCTSYDMRAACDLAAPPYRIDDTMDPLERTQILSLVADRASENPQICAHAQEALRMAGLTLESPDHLKAAAVLRYVQSNVGYRPDPPGEWFYGPFYTLQYKGDCTNLAPLAAALFKCAGLTAMIVWINQKNSKMNHIAVMVWLFNDWYWADPSIVGAMIGEYPRQAARRVAQGWKLGA